jgi:hypothetical protein
MFIAFTFEEFLDMMASYNATLWPMQLFLYALAIVALFFAIIKTNYSSKVVSGILAFLWLWIGIIFNFIYFSKLSPMANVFAILFVIEGLIFIMAGIIRKDLSFRVKADLYGVAGGLFIFYGVIAYPAIEYLYGRGYPQLLSFGLVPCPTTIFTLGILLWSVRRIPKYILIIPFLYSLSGVIPVYLGVVEDIGLIIAGISTTILILYRDRMKEHT